MEAEAARQIRTVLANADVTMTPVPVSPSDETIRERVYLVAQRERVDVHHITIQHLNDRLALALDLEVDGALPLAAAHATADRLEAAIRREFGRHGDRDPHRAAGARSRGGQRDADRACQSYVAALEEAAALHAPRVRTHPTVREVIVLRPP